MRALKERFPELGVITDIALDPYTSHGQDGLVDADGYVMNDETIEVLVKQALSHAEAGADVVAPSDMMDGRIGAIRNALEAAGRIHTRIPRVFGQVRIEFLRAVSRCGRLAGALGKGNKYTYQMDPANSDEALREVALDLDEGRRHGHGQAGHAVSRYRAAREGEFGVPTFVYQVSGEYAMRDGGDPERLARRAVIAESLLCIKRAGADAVLTYFAKRVAADLRERG